VVGGAVATGTVIAQERTPGGAVDDIGIFWQIKHNYLQKNAQDLLAGVSIEVIEGRVYLTGNVNTTEARIDAVRLAWQVDGVKEVINEININNEKTIKNMVQNKWIKGQLVSKMIVNKNIRSLNYSIEVVDGVVYLMGIARSNEELEEVTRLASTIKGVQKVISHVTLRNENRV
jgi:osmotically-inducible protein OsmY